MAISLSKDFIREVPVKSVEVENVGTVTMQDVGMEIKDELQRFYNSAMRPNYILGHQPLFNWMFKNNGSKVAVLTIQDQIIAHQGHVPIVFTNGEKDYRGFISATTIVDENFRRKGLMTFLRSSVQDRYEMACSIGGSDLGVKLYGSMGYKLCGYLNRMIAIVNLDKCRQIAQEPEKLESSISLIETASDNVKSIDNFSSIEKELQELVDQVLEPGKFFGVKRDAQFFNWRYITHPIYDYQCRGLWQDNKLKALIVYRIEQIPDAQTTVIRITDLIGQPEDIVKIITSTVLIKEVSSQVGWIDFFCANKKIAESLRLVGFLPPEELPTILPIFCNPVDYSKTRYPVMFWSKDESIHKDLPSLEDWYITKGDGDADRPNQLLTS